MPLTLQVIVGGVPGDDPRISVLYADLRGLPPILIRAGLEETLLDTATRLAAAAGDAVGEPAIFEPAALETSLWLQPPGAVYA